MVDRGIPVSVKAVSPCGESDLYSEYVPGCFAPSSAAAASNLNIYPNPSPGQVRIDLKQINKKASPTSQIKEIREIRIVDKMGAVKKVLQYPAGTQSASINIGNLPNDIYTLHISDGINRISKQLNKIN
ncbi:T9SS type A sorting domain-containing protein [Puia sp. P3]|uniref:T9SS type A sorting domain-containing protein n=1 Tax=Puia sp. P3 TaxID=3423952 RepID=UPI003D6699FA